VPDDHDQQDKHDQHAKTTRATGRRAAAKLLSPATLASLPKNIALVRRFMALTDWKTLHDEVTQEAQRKIAIVGLPNTGKSTLFNTLRGQRLSAVSPEAGTTIALIRGAFGPFDLMDTPGHLMDIQREAIGDSSVIVLLLDASRAVKKEDRELLREAQKANKPLVVVLNKADALRADPDDAAGELAAVLGVPDIIPISARDGTNVAEELIPALLDASPDAALAIGLALPTFRRTAAERMVRTATVVGLAAGLEPIPLVDIPILLGIQIRLVLRLAALYGEPMSVRHVRELGTTIAAGLGMRYLAEQLAKAVPIGGDVVSGMIAAAGTWAIGQVAIEYFENGKRFTRRQLNDLFNRYYRRYREDRLQRDLAAAKPTDTLPPASDGTKPAALPPGAPVPNTATERPSEQAPRNP
jgi:small GTP-binding protein